MNASNEFSGNNYRTPENLELWLAQCTESPIDTDLAVIDSHHHLWDNIRGKYLLPEFLADLAGNNVVGTVFLECGTNYNADVQYWSVGPDGLSEASNPSLETAYIVRETTQNPEAAAASIAAGIVGFCNLSLGAEATCKILDDHAAAGGARFCGVRQATAWDSVVGKHAYRAPPPGILLDDRFRTGFAELAKRGLTFDAWVFFPQMLDLVDLARSHPDSTIVLNHFGGPLNVGPYGQWPEETFSYWRRKIEDIAACPNVVLKLGGLGMLTLGFDLHLGATPPASRDLAAAWAPYIDHAVEVFGPDRCMFDSNFPVDSQTSSYTAMLNAYKHATRQFSASERQMIFSGTASRVYGLDLEEMVG